MGLKIEPFTKEMRNILEVTKCDAGEGYLDGSSKK